MEHDNDIQNDLFPLALMFIIAVYLFTIFPAQLYTKHKLASELLYAKEIAIYYYDRSVMLEESRTSLNAFIDEQNEIIAYQNSILAEKDKINRILKDLSQDTHQKTK